MDSLQSRLGGGGGVTTKSRVRVEVLVHPCLKARSGGLSLVGLVATVVSDQTDAEAGNGNTLMSHHPGEPQV